MIILKEHEWAQTAIANKTIGKNPLEMLCRVARYYIDEGCSKNQARCQLDKFVKCCDKNISLSKWSQMLDRAINYATKNKAVDIDYIAITKPEMDTIDSIKSKQVKRLAFVLLCSAKYWNIVNDNNNNWVNTSNGDIMSMANLKTSTKRKCDMYKSLCDAGLLEFVHRVNNVNVKVLFIQEGETVLKITDFRNLGYQYLLYHNQPFFKCEVCGITTKLSDSNNRRRQKYCNDCALKIHIQQNVNSVMCHREIKKTKL